MKKLLVILLLFFPVHGAWGNTEPIQFGDKNEYTIQFRKNPIAETISVFLQNSSADRTLVLTHVHFYRNNCDENTKMTFNAYKEVLPGRGERINIDPQIGLNYIDCYNHSWRDKSYRNRYDKYDTKETKPPPKEKTWLEKQKEKRKDKARAKDQCARKSGKAKTNRAADRIYRACMERKGY